MHELSLCTSIMSIVTDKAQTLKAKRITQIHLEIGTLKAIDKTIFQFSFSIASNNTIAENALLNIIEIPAKAVCETCQELISLQQYYDNCPKCGSHKLNITQGEELRVKSMVVE